MKNSLETRLGLFFALALIVAFILMEVVGSFDFLRPGLRLRARFANVQELNTGDPVKLGGKVIGRVESIDFVDNELEVVMKLEDPGRVRTDSVATIRFSGLLGQNYISLTFGAPAAAVVENNTLLATAEQADLGSLMNKLEGVASGVANLTTNLGGESLQNLVGPLVDFVRENNPRLTAILTDMQTVSSNVAAGRGTFGKLIYDDALYTTALDAVSGLSATATNLQTTLGSAQGLINDVGDGDGTLGLLVRDPTLYKEGVAAVTELHEILEKMNKGTGTVSRIVNDDTFYKNARLSLQKLDKATESLEDQGPLSVIGIVVGSLF